MNIPLVGFDAGGRIRVSQITTLGDYKMVGADRIILFDDAGTGTGAWVANKFAISVAGTQYQIRQSKRTHPYLSGKSQMVEITFDRFQHEAGVTKRIGYFSSSLVAPYTASRDGFWLESDGNKYYIKAERLGVETVSVENQAWDGWSEAHEYDWSMFTVILFDFLWLGGAILRLWLKTEKGFLLLHTVNYSGSSQDTIISSPSQPLRAEIRGTAAGGQFRFICAQVASEGSLNEAGIVGSVNTGATGISLTTIGTTYPLLGIRKKAARVESAVRVIGFSFDVASANDRMLWTLQINPTLSAGLTYADVTGYPIQKANGDGTITVTGAGTVIASGFMATGQILADGILAENFLATLGQKIDGTMDQYILCVTPITGGVSTHAEITIKDY